MSRKIIKERVHRYTRAGRNGRVIWCPHCGQAQRVFHFSWCGLGCVRCKRMVGKEQWLVGEPRAQRRWIERSKSGE